MRWMLALLVVASLAVPRRGAADDKPAADAAFADGQRLFDRGDYKAACRKFEQSLALAKQLGTLFNLARCHKMIGKRAAAYEEFRAAEPVARARGQKKRIQTAVVQAAELAGRLAWLTIVPPAGAAAGLEVWLDGRVVSADQLGKPRPVDPGPRVVEVAAPGHASRVTVVVTIEAQHRALELRHPPRLDGRPAELGGRPWLSVAWPEAVAAQAFRDGARLLEQGQDEEACLKLRASLEHAPQLRTRFHLAHCLDRLGKLAEASAELRAAEVAAEKSLDYERADFAAGRTARVQERMARLTIAPPPGAVPAGLEIRLDGHRLVVPPDTPLLLDPGPHVVEATAPGRAPFSEPFNARERSSHAIEVVLPSGPLPTNEQTEAPPVAPPPPLQPVRDEPGRGRRTAAVVTGSAGAAALGVSLFFAVRARSRWAEAREEGCESDGECPREGPGYRLLKAANADANRAAIAAGVGVVAVGTGVILYLTSPRGRRERARPVVTPLIGPGAVGIALDGSF